MPFSIRKSISATIIALVFGVSVAVFVTLAIINVVNLRSVTFEQLDTSGVRETELIKKAIEGPMVVGNDAATHEEFAVIGEAFPDTTIHMTDFNGNVTYSTNPDAVRKDVAALHAGHDELLETVEKGLASNIETNFIDEEESTSYFVRVASVPNEESCHHCHGHKAPILGAMVVMRDITPNVNSIRAAAWKNVFFSFGGLVTLLTVIVVFMRRSIIRRLQTITTSSDGVIAGDFSQNFNVPGKDELTRLGSNLGLMVDELKNKLGFSEGILKGMDMPCLVVDTDNRVSFANQKLLDMFEKPGTPEDYYGQSSSMFFHGEEGRQTITRRAMEEQQPINTERRYTLSDGREIIASLSSTPIYDMDRQLIGAFTQYFDLTEIREKEAFIEQQNQEMAAVAQEAEVIAERLATSAEELASQVEESSRGADMQRERTTETAAAMEQMSRAVLEVAEKSSNAADISDQTHAQAQDGAREVENSIATISRVEREAEKLRENMRALEEQAEDIGKIMQVIDDIADQTNLLALNAAIEAARAGEAGRGFAVVADEVRKLAEKTMNATKEVSQAVRAIQDGVHENYEGAESAAKAVAESAEQAKKSGEALERIVKLVETSTDQVRSIASATEEQSSASDEVNASVEAVNQIAVETSEAMRQSAEAVTILSQLAGELEALIRKLRN